MKLRRGLGHNRGPAFEATVAEHIPFFGQNVELPFVGTPVERPKSLDSFIGDLSRPRDGVPAGLDYEQYHHRQNETVNGQARDTPMDEGEFKRKMPQNVKNMSHYKLLDDLRVHRDKGLYVDADGKMVNPWYHPGPLIEQWTKHLGEDAGRADLQRFMQYNGPASIQTNVSQSVKEAAKLRSLELQGLPFDETQLTHSDLTGAAFHNKLQIANDIRDGKGVDGEGFSAGAHKIRNYATRNLQGVGAGNPVHNLDGTQVASPITMDSQMAEALKFRGPNGKQKERFVKGNYTEGANVVRRLGDEVEASGADTQAAIWQSYLASKHQGNVTGAGYTDPFARVLEDRVNRTATLTGETPGDTWKRFLIDGDPLMAKGVPNPMAPFQRNDEEPQQ